MSSTPSGSTPEVKHQDPLWKGRDGTAEHINGEIPKGEDDIDGHAETNTTTDVHASGTSSGVEQQVDGEKKDSSRDSSPSPTSSRQLSESEGVEDQTIVSWDQDDPENPFNFSTLKKCWIVFTSILLVMNSTIGSSLPSGTSTATQAEFHLDNESLLVLPVSIYLVGYTVGPLVFSPLSETYGRKIVMISTFIVFTAFTLGCALAPNYASLVIFRLFVGIGASTPVSVVGGIYADIYNNARARGLVITIFMTATTWGPIVGPILSGYVSTQMSWRWAYWIALIIAGATWPLLLLMPETYHSVLLQRRAKTLRTQHSTPRFVAPSELNQKPFSQLISEVLTRPLRMIFTEAIVACTCLYLSVAYAIFYMYFQAYPIIFEGIYRFSPGQEGLTFLPIGIGAGIACLLYLAWDSRLRRSKAKVPPPHWTTIEEYVRLPLACLGGPLFVISLFWLGWTANSSIHWIVPTLSALPFGIGFLLVFMGQLNYLVDAYSEYAASAMGAASCSRSFFGVVLPFAARPMYQRLGVSWASTLLGLLSLLMSLIPFVFIKYGDRIRAGSKFCQELRRKKVAREKEEEERRRERVVVEDVEKQ